MDIQSYQQYDGLGLAELIHKKEVSALDCVDAAIRLIEKHNPDLNAINIKDFDRARAQAKANEIKGKFAGVPFLLKDMVMVSEGLPSTCGSRYLKDYIWNHDSELVKRYRDAGLIILGKTNVTEFGLSPSSENKTFGDTKNPWNREKSAGGSSAGAAVAVASGMVPMAHATDGGGSIRIPASCCGLFGFKPTRGRMPTGPDYGRLWQGLAIDHAITRSVRDSAALLDISEGPDLGSPLYAPRPQQPFLKAIESSPQPLRIAYSTRPFFPADCEQACIRAVEFTAKLCGDLGHHVVQADLIIPDEEVLDSALVMMSSELAAGLNKFNQLSKKKLHRGDLELTTEIFHRYGQQHKATDFLKATQTFEILTRKVAQFFQEYDVLITPTIARLPINLGALKPSDWEMNVLKFLSYFPQKKLIDFAVREDAKRIMSYIPFTLLFNITGQPAMSLPMSYANGLPVGVQFAGTFAEDAMLLQLARQIEQAHNWHDNRPF